MESGPSLGGPNTLFDASAPGTLSLSRWIREPPAIPRGGAARSRSGSLGTLPEVATRLGDFEMAKKPAKGKKKKR